MSKSKRPKNKYIALNNIFIFLKYLITNRWMRKLMLTY